MKTMPEIKNTSSVQKLLSHAQTQALCRGHEFVMPEHLLYSLLDNSTFTFVISEFGSVETLTEELENYFKSVEKVPKRGYVSDSGIVGTDETLDDQCLRTGGVERGRCPRCAPSAYGVATFGGVMGLLSAEEEHRWDAGAVYE